jgi:hypothetical protein
MTHSVEVIGTESLLIDDGDLLILMLMMTEAVRARPEPFGVLTTSAEEWRRSADHYAPGCLQVGLASIARRPAVAEALDRLLETVRVQLQGHGDVIPAAVLKDKWRVRGVRFGDQDVRRLTDVLDKVHRFFRNGRAALG